MPMTYVTHFDTKLEVTDCCTCGVFFAAPARLLRERRDSGGTFYCPNGHPMAFREKTEDRLRRQLNASDARARHAEDQLEATQRSNRALKGVVTRTKRRAASGVCPVLGCKRSFENVARHVADQHPDYVHEEH